LGKNEVEIGPQKECSGRVAGGFAGPVVIKIVIGADGESGGQFLQVNRYAGQPFIERNKQVLSW
jgi:hypothetical protein